MKRKSPTPWLPFSRLLLRPFLNISLATWDLEPLSQHHWIKDMLPMKIYPYLSDPRNKKTDVNLNLFQWSVEFFNSMECDHRGKEEGKWGATRTVGPFWAISYFWIEVFVPRSPFGRRAVRQRGYGLRLLIFKSRSGSDKKRRNRLQ